MEGTPQKKGPEGWNPVAVLRLLAIGDPAGQGMLRETVVGWVQQAATTMPLPGFSGRSWEYPTPIPGLDR
jgi:hypothetical protein